MTEYWLTVNGRVVGLVLDADSISDEVVAAHRGGLAWIRLRGSGDLAPETIAALSALAGDVLALDLDWSGGEAFRTDQLAGLIGRLRHITVSGETEWVGTFGRLTSLEGLASFAVTAFLHVDSELRHVAHRSGIRVTNLTMSEIGAAPRAGVRAQVVLRVPRSCGSCRRRSGSGRGTGGRRTESAPSTLRNNEQ